MTKNKFTQSINRQHKLVFLASLLIALSALFVIYIANNIKLAHAQTTTLYSNGFEIDTAGWAGSGDITKVTSGTSGINSASGAYHAVVNPGSNGYTGPNTVFNGYGNEWPGDWEASIDIYLDPSWPTDSGFIYSVAANKTDGSHLRDFMINAGVLNDSSTGDTNKLVLLADTAGSPTADPLYQIKAMPAERRAEITTAGWYKIKHNFRNLDGRLVVDVSLLDSSDDLIKTWAIDYPWINDAVPSQVGANRYGWFTHVVVPQGLAIDNVSRSVSNNQYNISDTSTAPVEITLNNDQTLTILGTINGTVTTPVDITLKSTESGVQIFIPEGTQITAQDQNWDGSINSPILQSNDSLNLSDQSVIINAVAKVGSNTPLNFSQPVKVLLPGHANKHAGYVDSSNNLDPINVNCNSNPNTIIAGDIKECYEYENDDLVIWTNHFSTFIAYEYASGAATTSPTTNPTSPGAPNTGIKPQSILPSIAAIAIGSTMAISTTPYGRKLYASIRSLLS